MSPTLAEWLPLDDRLHDEMNKCVTVNIIKTGFSTILFKNDLEEIKQ